MERNILPDYYPKFDDTNGLILMPITRLRIKREFAIGPFKFYPPHSIDYHELRLINNLDTLANYGTRVLEFDVENLADSTTVAFIGEIPWEQIYKASIPTALKILQRFAQQAELALDMIRHDYCRFDVPEMLPGGVGTWKESSLHIGALLYKPWDHESHLLAAKRVSASIVSGIGTELDIEEIDSLEQVTLPRETEGELAQIAGYALSLARETFYAHNDTVRFMRAMTLFEYLGSPSQEGRHRKMQDLKYDVICHMAKSEAKYHELGEYIKEITGGKDSNGNVTGIRTLITHRGKFIEDILSADEIIQTFRQLQWLLFAAIDDIIRLGKNNATLEDLHQYRMMLKNTLGVTP